MSDLLRAILKAKMQELIPSSVIIARVMQVDEKELSITVTELDMLTKIYDVRLMPAMGEKANSIVCIPKAGSLALIGIINNNPGANYMIMCQECDKVIINGGDFGGLIKIQELQKQMKKDSAILQALLDIINGAPLTQPANSPSVLQTALKTRMSALQKGDYSEIENKNVTHG